MGSQRVEHDQSNLACMQATHAYYFIKMKTLYMKKFLLISSEFHSSSQNIYYYHFSICTFISLSGDLNTHIKIAIRQIVSFTFYRQIK